MKHMKKKAGLSIITFPIAILVFSLVIMVFYFVPYTQDVYNTGTTSSFFETYGVTFSSSNLSEYDTNSDISDVVHSMECDIIGTQNNTAGCYSKSTSGTDFVNLMVKGGYGALVTLFNSFWIGKDMIVSVATTIGIPQSIVNIIITIVTFIIIISLISLIFNRSDV